MNSVNGSEPHGEVHQTGSALSDVQLLAEDVPCTLCTVQRGGRKGRLRHQAASVSSLRISAECQRALCITQILHQSTDYSCTSLWKEHNHGCRTGHGKEMLELWLLVKFCFVFPKCIHWNMLLKSRIQCCSDFPRRLKRVLASCFGHSCSQLVPPAPCGSFAGR